MSLLNTERLDRVMAESDVDLLVATSPEHIQYSTNYRSFTQGVVRGADFFAVIPRGTSAPRVLIAPIGEMDLIAEKQPEVDQVLPYGVFILRAPTEPGVELTESDQRFIQLGIPRPKYATAVDALIDYLSMSGFAKARIGFDEVGVTLSTWQRMHDALPSAVIKPGYAIWEQVRMVKTGSEIELLRKAVAATEKAFLATLKEYREGLTEKELGLVYDTCLIEEGARPTFAVIAFGSHGAYPNAGLTDRKLKNGDSIRYDIGCSYQGYQADIARTVVFGTPSEMLRSYYRAILRGEEAAIARLGPGETASTLFRDAVETTRRNGIPDYERNHVGHGIGIQAYDPPVLRPTTSTVIETAMVFCVETPFYEIGWGGVQVEDTLVVTSNGPEYLTKTDHNLWVV